MSQLLKSLECLENNIKPEPDCSSGLSNTFKVKDKENYEAFESDEVILIKEVFSGAYDELFPRHNVHYRRSTSASASKKWNQALQC